MNILGTSTVASVQKKAEGALGMFKQALTKLEASNTEAEALEVANAEKISSLQEENKQLNEILSRNDKVIDNIRGLIGE